MALKAQIPTLQYDKHCLNHEAPILSPTRTLSVG